jgi:hypothetical protein
LTAESDKLADSNSVVFASAESRKSRILRQGVSRLFQQYLLYCAAVRYVHVFLLERGS